MSKMKKLKPDVRTDQILDAAIHVAVRDGFHNMTRDNVAIQAGCSMGLVTRYYGTMTQLRRAVMRRAIKDEQLNVLAQGLAYGDDTARKAPVEMRIKAVQLIQG